MAEKVEYWTQEGHKTLHIIVSFLPVPTGVGNHTVDRATEFFMPVGQSGESQQWITSSMRLLSPQRAAVSGACPVGHAQGGAGPRGPCAWARTSGADGAMVPMWHDSEVAAIVFCLCKTFWPAAWPSRSSNPLPLDEPEAPAGMPPAMAGKKCSECGAHAVIRKDGCDYCTQCGHLGSCG